MDRDLQAALWDFVKTRRDELASAQRRYEEAEALLQRMQAAGLDDHLPSLEDVRAAFNATAHDDDRRG